MWKYRLIFSEDEFTAYFKFAFVRNPWDRLVSAYHFLIRGGYDHWDQAWAAENLTPFDDFADFVHRWVTPQNIHTWIHFRPQHEFIFDAQGYLLVNFLGRYENLADDFATVARRLEVDTQLTHANRSTNRRDYRGYYDDKTAAIVADVYAQDIALLDYSFNP